VERVLELSAYFERPVQLKRDRVENSSKIL
jgi:hypothetical protein